MIIKIARVYRKRIQKLASFAERAGRIGENIQTSRHLLGNKPQKRVFVV